jgi:tetratricopeptide (TPR) repeat protein
LRSSSKTVQLLRLKQDLRRRGFAVVMFSAEDYLNMHEPLNVVHDLGDSAAAAVHYQQALDIFRRLAEQLGTPQAQRDLSVSLDRLGDVTRDLGDPAAAATHHQQALDIDRRLAEQLGTARALQDLRAGLADLARTEEELGNADAAAALRAELATVSDRLAALSDDPPPDQS